jgi:hypothetical protein
MLGCASVPQYTLTEGRERRLDARLIVLRSHSLDRYRRAGIGPIWKCAASATTDLHTPPMEEETLATLTKARSMLILLLATCQQTQLALEAASNALDTDLTSDLAALIERTEHELAALTKKIQALPD